jgi:hypothetical protein
LGIPASGKPSRAELGELLLLYRLCDTILIKSAAAGISEALAFDLPQVPDI